jgi:hypothetical protein
VSYLCADRSQVLEAIFNNVSIFLDQPSWRSALERSIVQDNSLSDRSEPVVRLWMIASYAPGLFVEATKVIMYQQFARKLQVLSELHRLSNEYTSWYNEWEHVLHTDQALEQNETSSNSPFRLQHADILTRYYSQMALLHQFMYALSPHHSSIVAEAAWAAATEVTRISEGLGVTSIAKLRVRVALHIAISIQKVSEVWKQAAYTFGPSETIKPAEFSRWCSIIGRSDGNPMSCILLSARIKS